MLCSAPHAARSSSSAALRQLSDQPQSMPAPPSEGLNPQTQQSGVWRGMDVWVINGGIRRLLAPQRGPVAVCSAWLWVAISPNWRYACCVNEQWCATKRPIHTWEDDVHSARVAPSSVNMCVAHETLNMAISPACAHSDTCLAQDSDPCLQQRPAPGVHPASAHACSAVVAMTIQNSPTTFTRVCRRIDRQADTSQAHKAEYIVGQAQVGLLRYCCQPSGSIWSCT